MRVGGLRHVPAALPPGKTRYPLCRRLGGAAVPVWTGAENLAFTGIRYPDHPARSESIYGLSCPGPNFRIHISVILLYAATYPEWSVPFVHALLTYLLTYLITYLITSLLTYSLNGAESFLRS